MKITVAGLGIKEAEQITLETLSKLREVNLILVLPIVGASAVEKIKKLTGKKVICLKDLYRNDAKDEENYQGILDAVIGYLAEYKTIALLVPGHPRIGVTLVNWLEKLAPEKEFSLNVLPGISSFCTLINDLRFDPLERGTVVADANRLLLLKTKIDPALNLLVYHVCSVGTARISVDKPLKNNRLDLLKDFLVRTYGPRHEVKLVSSSTGGQDTPLEIQVRLQDFETCYPLIHYGTTLFVPAKAPTAVDRNFLSLVQEA